MNARTNPANHCAGKVAHAKREAALAAIGAFGRTGTNTARLAAYRCVHCRAWHVGNRPGKRRRR